MDTHPVLGVIGGSGLYSLEGLEDARDVEATTPFGRPSGAVRLGRLRGQPVAFLARHGQGHRLLPSEVNYRANIYALKELGVRRVLSISACGSLRDDLAPGHMLVPDQLFDATRGREVTFFGEGLVAHVGVADPFCPQLGPLLASSIEKVGGTVRRGGSMITIEGPRFSTRAESNVYRSWGMSAIGMTTSPEAFLAREAELCYTVLAHVTDYDVWHLTEEPVSVEAVVRTLRSNARRAEAALLQFVEDLPADRTCSCGTSLEKALITSPEVIPTETRRRLAPLVDPHLA